jgi:CPA2 family monovalent cation:H+ antiporter-2
VAILQDLAVIPILVFFSTDVSGADDLAIAFVVAAFKCAAVIAAVMLAQRTLLRRILKYAAAAEAPEVFTGATLLLVLGTGWATEQIGLSMALGALLAGMAVARSVFRHQVAADIQPFRGLLLGLFFITIGIGLDLGLVFQQSKLLALIVLALMLGKAAVVAGLGFAFRLARRRVVMLAALLAPGSEFAFVLLPMAQHQELLASREADLLIAAVALSMALTPLLAMVIDRGWRPGPSNGRSLLGNLGTERTGVAGHVVIAGFGQVGMAVARHLAGLKVPLIILDLNPKRVTASRTRGLPVFYGNAARLDVLRAAHLDRAAALVVAVPDPVVAEQVTGIARMSFRDLRIFARVPDEEWVQRIRKAGADAVVPEGLTTALDLAERVMVVVTPED